MAHMCVWHDLAGLLAAHTCTRPLHSDVRWDVCGTLQRTLFRRRTSLRRPLVSVHARSHEQRGLGCCGALMLCVASLLLMHPCSLPPVCARPPSDVRARWKQRCADVGDPACYAHAVGHSAIMLHGCTKDHTL